MNDTEQDVMRSMIAVILCVVRNIQKVMTIRNSLPDPIKSLLIHPTEINIRTITNHKRLFMNQTAFNLA